MIVFEDILGVLMIHLRIARAAGGAEITKGDGFYHDRLGELDEGQRERVIAWCADQGVAAGFGRMPLGGTNLTLRKTA